MKVAYIDKVNHPSLDEIVRCAMTQKVMALDFEGDLRYEGRIVWYAMRATDVLDAATTGGALAGVLENPQIIKVIHACQVSHRHLVCVCARVEIDCQQCVSIPGYYIWQRGDHIARSSDRMPQDWNASRSVCDGRC
eukprot:3860111-Rhodomonas_salina.2